MAIKDEIVQQAMRLFLRDGWREVSIRQIADALSISPGNLTYHFPRKDDLVVALLSEVFAHENRQYRQLEVRPVTMAAFLGVMHDVLRIQLDHHGILTVQFLYAAEVMSRQGLSADSERAAIYRKSLERLDESAELELTGEDVAFLTAFLQLFIRGWIMDQQLDGGRDINRYIYLLAQQLYYFATEKGMASIDEYLMTLES